VKIVPTSSLLVTAVLFQQEAETATQPDCADFLAIETLQRIIISPFVQEPLMVVLDVRTSKQPKHLTAAATLRRLCNDGDDRSEYSHHHDRPAHFDGRLPHAL
jgi:hypothetical protein